MVDLEVTALLRLPIRQTPTRLIPRRLILHQGAAQAVLGIALSLVGHGQVLLSCTRLLRFVH